MKIKIYDEALAIIKYPTTSSLSPRFRAVSFSNKKKRFRRVSIMPSMKNLQIEGNCVTFMYH